MNSLQVNSNKNDPCSHVEARKVCLSSPARAPVANIGLFQNDRFFVRKRTTLRLAGLIRVGL